MEDSLEAFRSALSGSKHTLLLCHDFPDPDCLASSAGLQFLLKRWKIPSVVAFGGFIGRAENRALVQKLELDALPLGGLEFSDFDRTVFVDTQPGIGNHSLPEDVRRDCAIDHHPLVPESATLSFCDVREEMGATSTIVTQYLRKSKVEINYKLATALYYGLKSDTQDLSRESSAMDREVYHFLFSRVDHRLLSQIENPDLDRDFFEFLTRAFQSLETKEGVGFCYLGKIPRPDLVAEMADQFLRLHDMKWILALGYLKTNLYFSLRSRNLKAEAGEVARKLVSGETGSAGGHGQMAAGRLTETENMDQLVQRIKTRYHNAMLVPVNSK